MRYPKGTPSHGKMGACPKDWDSTPCITGLYTLDAVIKQNKNKNIPDRLKLYCDLGRENAYGGLTGYDGYHGYHGDN